MSWSPKLTTDQTIQVVVLVLEDHQGNILLTQRQKHQHLAGYWEFPGGKVKHGESLVEALKREISEELDGYTTQTPTHLMQINHPYQDFKVQLDVFYYQDINPEIHTSENQAMKWVSKNDLPNHQLPEANQAIVTELLSNQP